MRGVANRWQRYLRAVTGVTNMSGGWIFPAGEGGYVSPAEFAETGGVQERVIVWVCGVRRPSINVTIKQTLLCGTLTHLHS